MCQALARHQEHSRKYQRQGLTSFLKNLIVEQFIVGFLKEYFT